MVRRALTIAAVLFGLNGCGTVDFDKVGHGTIRGTVIVMWVGEGDSSGDGNFLYIPDRADPLIFTRPRGKAPVTIQPGMMYTDGGSIPKIAQVFKGLSPWGYAPAYMVHDWVFAAHHCIVDGSANPIYAPIKTVEFTDSAEILAEAIHALMDKQQVRFDDIAGDAITAAVDSVVAKNLWAKTGVCDERKVSAKDRMLVDAKLREAAFVQDRVSPRGLGLAPAPPGAGRVRIVARVKL